MGSSGRGEDAAQREFVLFMLHKSPLDLYLDLFILQ